MTLPGNSTGQPYHIGDAIDLSELFAGLSNPNLAVVQDISGSANPDDALIQVTDGDAPTLEITLVGALAGVAPGDVPDALLDILENIVTVIDRAVRVCDYDGDDCRVLADSASRDGVMPDKSSLAFAHIGTPDSGRAGGAS